jgi:aspartate racemase
VKIGIVGGIGYRATLEYYRRIMEGYYARYQNIDYPEVVIYSLSHGTFKHLEDTHSFDEYEEYIGEAIFYLDQADVDIIVLAANSPHSIFDRLQKRTATPIPNVLDSTLRHTLKLGVERALLLGIKFTMQSTFYQDHFARAGVTLIAPGEADQDRITECISNNELNTAETVAKLVRAYNVDSVVLGCMRLPLLVDKSRLPGINVIDALECHIRDIVNLLSAE